MPPTYGVHIHGDSHYINTEAVQGSDHMCGYHVHEWDCILYNYIKECEVWNCGAH